MRKFIIPVLFLASVSGAYAQQQLKRLLFLGNSYTYVNNLPALTAALARSAGDSLVFDANMPGGYTLGWQPIAHATDPVSLSKIAQNPWDFVVLQDQSQLPSIPVLRDSCMLPASAILRDSVVASHPCTRLLFFLTWGRRFGGTQCFTPDYCSANFTGFNQMQDSLTRAYKLVADSLHGWIAPAGEAWRLVLNGSNMVLHDADHSHPNLKGSYLAACVFYASVFGKPSTGLLFYAGLSPDTAWLLQRAADSVVFSYASVWNLWKNLPEAGFSLRVSADTLYTENTCTNATRWEWDFGDGETSADFEPIHVFSAPGTYSVTLTACDSCQCDSVTGQVQVVVSGTHQPPANQSVYLCYSATDETIRCIGCPTNGTLQFSDIAGRIVLSTTPGKKVSRHRLPAPGVYFWTIRGSSAGRLTGKLFIP